MLENYFKNGAADDTMMQNLDCIWYFDRTEKKKGAVKSSLWKMHVGIRCVRLAQCKLQLKRREIAGLTRVREYMYSRHLITAVQVAAAGVVGIKWRVKRSATVGFITSMFTV